MTEEKGNIWDKRYDGCWRVIPINCTVNSSGELIMGKGLAEIAKQRQPKIAIIWGYEMKRWKDPRLDAYGRVFGTMNFGKLIGFPTKYFWRERSDLELIKKCLIDFYRRIVHGDFPGKIVLPRLGCGKETGRLLWQDVKPLVIEFLNFDNVIVVHQ